ncbi:MAG: hypothetical protein IT304_03000 [Dehalococcoidia bacterium]|nr:hypothetical protein [Dehalococcoidia bacterium]
MPRDVVVPNLGLGSRPAFLAEWYCADGATVSRGEPVYRLECDFVAIDVEAEADGVLRHRLAAGGIAPGDLVALILAPGERLPRELPASDRIEEAPAFAPAWAPETAPEPPSAASHPAEESAAFPVAEASTVWNAVAPSPSEAPFAFAERDGCREQREPADPTAADPAGEAPASEPAHVLFLRRGAPPAPAPLQPDGAWDPVPGDEVELDTAWLAPVHEEPNPDAGDDGHPFPNAASQAFDWRRFEVVPEAEPVTADAGFHKASPADLIPFPPRAEAAAERPDASAGLANDAFPLDEAGGPVYPPVVLTFQVTAALAEADKLCAQLAREWRLAEIVPVLEDVVMRAMARAARESTVLADRGTAVGLVVVDRATERLLVVEDAAARPFRDAVAALGAAEEPGDPARCAVTLLALEPFGLDQGAPPLPAGHPLALATGAPRDGRAVLTLAFAPDVIPMGEAAWFLGRVRELVEAPYALLAD